MGFTGVKVFTRNSRLQSLPGNKKLNFFGEPLYVLPKS